jgi:hypothetical protein
MLIPDDVSKAAYKIRRWLIPVWKANPYHSRRPSCGMCHCSSHFFGSLQNKFSDNKWIVAGGVFINSINNELSHYWALNESSGVIVDLTADQFIKSCGNSSYMNIRIPSIIISTIDDYRYKETTSFRECETSTTKANVKWWEDLWEHSSGRRVMVEEAKKFRESWYKKHKK